MFSKTIHFGIALGLVFIGSFILQYHQDLHTNPGNIYVKLMYPIMAIFIILAIIKAYNTSDNFTLKDGLKTGMGVVLVSGVMLWIYILIHAAYIEPDYADKIAVVMKEQLASSGFDYTDKEIQERITAYKRNFSFSVFLNNVFFTLITGFIGSLIASYIVINFIKKN